MKLTQPLIITTRLLPGVQIGDGFVSIEEHGYSSDDRIVWKYYIDGPDWEYSDHNLKSEVGGETLQEGLALVLSSLESAVRLYEYNGLEMDDDDRNVRMFPDYVTLWASRHSCKISMLWMELDESELISD